MELFDRQKDAVGQGERTILVHIELTSINQSPDSVMNLNNLLYPLGLILLTQ